MTRIVICGTSPLDPNGSRGANMPIHDIYLYQRAEAELARAQAATDPAAGRIHQELASLYLDRFYNPDAYASPARDAERGTD